MTALAEQAGQLGNHEALPPKRVQLEVELDADTLQKMQAMWPTADSPGLDKTAFRRLLLEFFNEVDLGSLWFRALK